MRRPFLALIALIVFTLPALPLVTAGCAGAGLSTLDKPADMLKTALDSCMEVTSLTGTFTADLQLHLDASQLPQEDLALVGMFQSPATISGTLAYSAAARAFDADVTLGAAGFSYNLGLRVLEEQGWIRMFGQWYDFTSVLADAAEDDLSLWEETYSQQELERHFARLGIVVEDWFGEPILVGAEDLAGTAVYHLACAPDVELMVHDAMTLLQDREFLNLVDPGGSLFESMGEDLPSLGELRDLAADIPEMLEDFTLDLWVGKSDGLLRQASGYLNVLPPVGAELDGLDRIEVSATITLDTVNKPVAVQAPAAFLPLSALEEMFGDPSSLMPFMGTGDEDGIFSY
jgi:hypothetical protein